MSKFKRIKLILFLYKFFYFLFFTSLTYSLVVLLSRYTMSSLYASYKYIYKQNSLLVYDLKNYILEVYNNLYIYSLKIFILLILIYIVKELLFISKKNVNFSHCKIFKLNISENSNKFVIHHEKFHCYFMDSLIFYLSKVIMILLMLFSLRWILLSISLYFIPNISSINKIVISLVAIFLTYFAILFTKSILKVTDKQKGLFEMLADMYAVIITNNYREFQRKIFINSYNYKLNSVIILIIGYIIFLSMAYKNNFYILFFTIIISIVIIYLHTNVVKIYKNIKEEYATS